MKQIRKDLRSVVSDAARRVYKELGSGFNEQVYGQAMAIELRSLGLDYEVERNIEVFYKGERVGLHRLDFIVNRSLVIELKAAGSVSDRNFAQTRAYLKTTALRFALVINFPSAESDDGPVIEFVQADQQASCPTPNGSRKTKGKPPTLLQVKRAARPVVRLAKPKAPKGERIPLSDQVWDSVARRYVRRRSRSVLDSLAKEVVPLVPDVPERDSVVTSEITPAKEPDSSGS
jgi:GxxExxY protein